MGRKNEIHAFDYAVVEFVAELNHLFRFALNTIELQIAGGLRVETKVRPPLEMQATIWPASWPKTSQLSVRFQKCYRDGEGAWKAFEGALVARHLPHQFSEFLFECHWDENGYYRFKGKNLESEMLLKRLHTARAATELDLKHLLD